MTRLKYKRNENNQFCSSQVLCGTDLYSVVLHENLVGHVYLHRNTNKIYVLRFEGISLSDLKKKAKIELKKLGANFNGEIRNRGNTEKLDLEKL